VVFGLVGLGHLLRILFAWPLVIGTYPVPMAISWAAVVLTAGLVAWVIAMMNQEKQRRRINPGGRVP
jgi:hypothetical protein